jgi:hypothetical protein
MGSFGSSEFDKLGMMRSAFESLPEGIYDDA